MAKSTKRYELYVPGRVTKPHIYFSALTHRWVWQLSVGCWITKANVTKLAKFVRQLNENSRPI